MGYWVGVVSQRLTQTRDAFVCIDLLTGKNRFLVSNTIELMPIGWADNGDCETNGVIGVPSYSANANDPIFHWGGTAVYQNNVPYFRCVSSSSFDCLYAPRKQNPVQNLRFMKSTQKKRSTMKRQRA